MEKVTFRTPVFWGIFAKPGVVASKIFGIIPIALLIGAYLFVSHARHVKNSEDKLMPSITQMYHAVKEITTVPDKRSGKNLFLEDTKASLKRLCVGVAIAAVSGYSIGILMGLFPGFRTLLNPLITGLSNINPLALLVIVLVVLGIGEQSKIFLVAFGVGIPIARTIAQMVQKIPYELIVKSLTLGASQKEIVAKIVAPQMLPRLIDLVRVSLGAAWIFVIAAEAVASTEGLGYRIYLQQRYMNMALIIPYVVYISLLAYLGDLLLQLVLKLKWFRWYGEK